MKNLLFSLILFSGIALNSMANGNLCIVDLRYSTENIPHFDHLVICEQSDTVGIEIQASDNQSLNGLQLSLGLPAGFTFDGYLSVLPAGPVMISNNNPQSPVFLLPNIGSGAKLKVFFTLAADCQIKDMWENIEPIQVSYNLNYSGGSYSYTSALEYNTEIYVPVINIMDINPSYPVLKPGDVFVREILLSQDGIRAWLKDFHYRNEYNGAVEYISLAIGDEAGINTVTLPFTDNGTEVSADITSNILNQIGLNGIFNEDQRLVIKETLRVVNCHTEVVDQLFKTSWGCNNAVCDEKIVYNGLAVSTGFPHLNTESGAIVDNGSCGTNTYNYTIQNNGFEFFTGTGYAKDISLEIKPGCASDLFNESYQLQWVKINGYSMPIPLATQEGSYLISLQNIDSMDADGLADDLDVGTSFTLQIAVESLCTNTSCGDNELCNGDIGLIVHYQNICDVPQAATHFSIAGKEAYAIGAPYIEGDPNIVSSPDNFVMSFCYGYYSSMPACDGASVALKVKDNSGLLQFISANIDNGINSTAVNITPYTAEEDTYLISGGSIAEGLVYDCWDINLLYDDPCGYSGYADLDFEVIYYCPCSGCEIVRSCDTYHAYINNGCVGVCNNVQTTDINITRTSFSYTNAGGNVLANSSTPSVVLDRAYTCDHIQCELTGVVQGNNISNAGVIFTMYLQGIENPYEFLSGQLIVNGFTLPCGLTAPIMIQTEPGVYEVNFNFSNCLSANNITLHSGEDIKVMINSKVIAVPWMNGSMSLTQFVGSFYSMVNGTPVQCINMAKDFYVANPEVVPQATASITTGCSGNVEMTGSISILSASGDDFPNEYRPWYGDVSVSVFNLPLGFTYVPNSGQLEVLGPNNSILPLEPQVTNNGQTISFDNTNGTWPVPDKDMTGEQMRFKFELTTDCLEFTSDEFSYGYTFKKNLYAQPFEPSCIATMSEMDYKHFINDPPVLHISPLNLSIEGLSREVFWDIQVCNISQHTAPFAWLGFENAGNLFTFISLEDITDADNVIQYPLTSYTTGNNVFAQIGGLNSGVCKLYRITANFADCENPETIQTKLGWSCNMPQLIASNIFPMPPNCGGIGAHADLGFLPKHGKIQEDLINFDNTIPLCEEGSIELEFKNVEQTYLYDVVLEITLPIDGMEMVDGSFEVAYLSGAAYNPIAAMPVFQSINPQGKLYILNLSDLIPALADGFIPEPNEIENRFMLRFDYITDCDYASGEVIRLATYGQLPCGEKSEGTLQAAQLFLDGQTPPYNASYELMAGDITPCQAVNTTIKVRVTNNGPGIMGNFDFLRLRLPVGLLYQANTISDVFPQNWTPGEPEINMIFDMQEIIWPLPNNIAIGEVVEISFDIQGQESITCFTDSFAIDTYTYGIDACGSNPTPSDFCTVQIITGSADLAVQVSKPDLQFTANTNVYSSCNGSIGERINTHIEFINNGEAINAGTTTYFSFLQDVNADGIQDEGDLLLYTFPYTDPIPSFQTISLDRSFDIAAGMGCPLLITVDDLNNCICSVPTIFFATVQYYNAGDDITICSNQEIQIGCEPVMGYTYSWSSVQDPSLQYLSCTTCANPSVSIPNTTAASQSYTYSLHTVRGQYATSCATTDQIAITIRGGADEMGPVYTLCEGETVQFQGPVTSSSVLWSPINGFGDITSTTPIVTPLSGTTLYYMNYEDAQGCPLRFVVTTHVEPNPVPVIVVDGDISFCEGTGAISLSVSENFATYNWYRSGNSSVLSTASTYAPEETGSYYVTVTSNTFNQCLGSASEPVMITVEEYNQPMIWPQGPITLCPQTEVTFFVLGDYPQVMWYEANNPPPTGLPVFIGPIFTTAAAGTYFVQATDTNGCTGVSAYHSVNLYPQQALVIQSDGITGNQATLCEGESLLLHTIIASFEQYRWFYNGSLIAGEVTSIEIEMPGSYEVQAIDPNGCEMISEPFFVQMAEHPQPGIEVDGEQIFCEGENIILSVTESHDTYQWYKNGLILLGATNFELSVSASGSYKVVVTDNGCEGVSFDVPVTVNPLPTVTLLSSASAPQCMGATVTLTVGGNYASYTWYRNGAWATEYIGSAIVVNKPGNYYVIVTDLNGCTAMSNIIPVNFFPLPQVEIEGDMGCEGGTGVITATLGFAQYHWYVNGLLQIGISGNVLHISNVGTVYVEVVDSNGCTGISEQLLLEYFPASMANISATDTEICPGEEIILSANSNAVSYLWSPAVWLSCTDCVQPIARPMNNITYSVTITDINGCTNTESIAITVRQPSPVSIAVSDPEICEGEVAVLTATPGFAMYTWILNGVTQVAGGWQNYYNVTEQGWYSVQIYNSFGCVTESFPKFIKVFPNPEVELTITGDGSFCEGQSLNLFATPGLANYLWTMNEAIVQNGPSNTFSTSATGQIMVTGTTNNDCENSSNPIFVNGLGSPSPHIYISDEGPLCPGEEVTLTIAGLYPQIIWKIGNMAIAGAVSNTLTVNEPGLYSVFVDDLQGCSGQSLPVEVSYFPDQEISFEETMVSVCGTQNLPYLITAPAGFSNYAWYKNGSLLVQDSQSPMLAIHETGDYTVTVTDENGCDHSSTNFFSVMVYDDILMNILPSATEICQGGSSVLYSSEAGVVYSWFPDTGLSCTDCPQPIASPSITTTYTLVLEDVFGCVISASTEIIVNPLPSVTINATNTAVCEGSYILLSALPGFVHYTWIRDGVTVVADGNNLISFTATVSGIYQLEVTNIYGCVSLSNSIPVTLYELPEPSLQIISEGTFCEGMMATVQTQPGYVNYNWYVNGGLVQTSDASTLILSTSGEVYVTATDANGCSGQSNMIFINLNPNPEPQIILGGPVTVCNGDGVMMSILGYYEEIIWMRNGQPIPAANANTYLATQSGIYTVYVNDNNGCEGSSAGQMITIYPDPEVEITPDQVNMCNAGNGEVTLTATTGFVNYKWYNYGVVLVQDGADNELVVDDSGIYTAVVTDSNGCTGVSKAVNVDLDAIPVVNLTADDNHVCVGESVQLFANGNAVSYTWAPQNGTLSCLDCATPIATPTVNTNYQVTITDINGCENSQSLVILVDAIPQPVITLENDTDATACEGDFVTLLASPGYAMYRWIKDTYTTVQYGPSPLFAAMESGQYSVMVTNAAGCENVSPAVSVNILPLPEVEISIEGDHPFCEGGAVSLMATPGLDNYAWYINGELYASNGYNQVIVNEDAYVQLVATSYNGCDYTSELIRVYTQPLPAPHIYMSGDAEICDGENLVLSVTGIYSVIQWYKEGIAIEGASSASYYPTASGNYSVYVNDGNGCEGSSDEVAVAVIAAPDVVISGGGNICSDGGSVMLTATPGYAQYYWYRNGTTLVQLGTQNSFEAVAAGDYYVIAFNSNGCTGQSNGLPVAVYPEPPLNLSASDMMVCPGEEVHLFTNSNASTVVWTSTDPSMSCTNCPNPIIHPLDTHTYSVIITDHNACMASGQITIEVESAGELTIVGENELCEGGGELLLNVMPAYASYQWYRNGLPVYEATGPYLTVTQDGDYSVTAFTGSGCDILSETFSVHYLSAPDPEIIVNGPSEICVGVNEMIILSTTSSSNGVNHTGYTWYYDPGHIAVGNAMQYVPPVTGTYTVEVMGADGCSGISDPVYVAVHPQMPAPAIYMLGENNLCAGEPVTIYIAGNYETVYWYEAGDANNPLYPYITHVIEITEAGTYYALATDLNGCSAVSGTITITNNSMEIPVIIGDLNLCTGGQTLLQVSDVYGSYLWYWNDLLLTGFTTPAISVIQPGTYYVVVTSMDGYCEVATMPVQVSIGQPIDISFVLPANACPGTDVMVDYNGLINLGYNYQWNFDGGMMTSGSLQQGFMVNWITAGEHTVTLTVSTGACTYTYLQIIQVGSVGVNVNPSVTPVSYCGGMDGSINLLISANPSMYSISWTGPSGYTGTGWNIYNLAAGSYWAHLMDSYGCEMNVNVMIPSIMNEVYTYDDFYYTSENETILLCVLSNDSGSGLGIGSILSLPSHGNVSVQPEGCILYTPNPGFCGDDQFTYQAVDLCGQTDMATAFINIFCDDNQPPVSDTIHICTPAMTAVDICPEFIDPDGDDTMITDGATTWECSISFPSDDCIRYIPLPGLAGTDTIRITVCDDQIPAACAEFIILVHVGCGQPLAVADILTLHCDDIITPAGNDNVYYNINVLANDSNEVFCEETLSLTIISTPKHGIATISADLSIHYTPAQGYSGSDQLTYQICNSCGNCDTAVLQINVPHCEEEPQSPCNNISYYCLAPMTPITICPDFCHLMNSDFLISSVISINNCNITIPTLQCITYMSVPMFEGSETLELVACNTAGLCDTAYVHLTVGDCENAQVLAVNDMVITPFNEPILIDVLDNDTGFESGICSFTQPVYGSVEISMGQFLYTPDLGYSGIDVFTYTLCNPAGIFSEANVQIAITNSCSSTQTICHAAGIPLQICPQFCFINNPVLGTITPSSTLNVSVETSGSCIRVTPVDLLAQNGILSVTGCEGIVCETIIYNVNFGCAMPVAADDFTITMAGVLVQIPVLDNDYDHCANPLHSEVVGDPAHGTVETYPDGSITYSPEPGFTGVDQFVYTACNNCNINCAPATVSITVMDSYQLIANDDEKSVLINTRTYFAVTDNDILPAGFSSSIQDWTKPAHGWTVLINDKFIYEPELNYAGIDSFTYTLCAGALCDEARVRMNVSDALSAADDMAMSQGNMVAISVLDNDSNVGENASVNISSFPQNGQVVVNSDGTINYQPHTGFSGTDSFIYEVCNEAMNCDTATVTITVEAGEAILIAIDDQTDTHIDTEVIIPVLNNDIYTAGTIISLISVAQPEHGAVVINDDQVAYTPDADYVGLDYFTYSVCNESGLCDEALVTVQIKSCDMLIPDAFSPNGDGVNDQFDILNISCYSYSKILVYNRWGAQVYSKTGLIESHGWKGENEKNGEPLPDGTYFYILYTGYGYAQDEYTGYITLRR